MGSLALHLSFPTWNCNATAARNKLKRRCVRALYVDDGEIAPISKGDGFSFYGGKYSDEKDKTDEWWERGDFMYAYSPKGSNNTIKDPLFGLKLGTQSQISSSEFRWFCVEEGTDNKHALLLLHGLCSQAYSFRHVISSLAKSYRVIAVDWLGFGFSDKPLDGNGFTYTTQDYSNALASLINEIQATKLSIVVQGHFAPAVVQFIDRNPQKVYKLIMINPPVSEEQSKLPPTLLDFTNLLFGDIYAQDPFKASDGAMARMSFYAVEEEDKMVYRKPYLSSGTAGFALKSISKRFKNELKDTLALSKSILTSSKWKIPTYIIGGKNDNWLEFNILKKFCDDHNFKLRSFEKVGHHVQEDIGEDLVEVVTKFIEDP